MNTRFHTMPAFAPYRFLTVRPMVAILALLALLGLSAQITQAQSPFNLKASGSIQFSASGVSTFSLSGTETGLKQCTGRGEIKFASSKMDGPLVGTGAVIFKAANGDQLVGIATLNTDAKGVGQITFSWRNSVQLSNGTTVSSTGGFTRTRPGNASIVVKTKPNVVIAIIAILIGL